MPRVAGARRVALAPRHVAVAIVAAAVAIYPAITLAGGAPRFPDYADCVKQPTAGSKARVVFGYAETYSDANALRDRVLDLGFEGTEVAQDGCGRLRVSLNGVPSLEVASKVATEARQAGLEPTLEGDPGD